MSIVKGDPRQIYERLEDNANALLSLTQLLSGADKSAGIDLNKFYYLLSLVADKQVELVNQLSKFN